MSHKYPQNLPVSNDVFKVSSVWLGLGVCFILFLTPIAYAKEYSLEADISARAEVNDNIFLTTLPHDTTTGLIITPTLSGIVKEEHWEANLDARIKSHNYSDSNLNSNDQYFDLSGRYLAERNIFALNVKHDLASNLNSTSSDFGIVGRRIDTKKQSITPSYTRLFTERLLFTLSYTYTDVDFLEADNTNFTPYTTESGSGSLVYDFTERDKISVSLYAVDYKSKNELVTYQLLMSRFGIEHKFSEILSADFLAGVSRRNSTNLVSTEEDFFGNIITRTLEIDAEDRGFVLDAGIKQQLESGQIEGRISRDNTTNSFGGLDQVDKIKVSYDEKLSSLWRYKLSARIEDITSISSGSRTTDRDVLFLEARVFYSFTRNWKANASYRYVQRKFKSGISEDRAPHSNRIYIGLSYNFPTLSTF